MSANDAEAATLTQAQRMRAAVDRAVAVGPDFLEGRIDADAMTGTMVRAVNDYVETEQALGAAQAAGADERELVHLQQALGELMACGSGYRAGRCDADCVARTMTEMVREFATS